MKKSLMRVSYFDPAVKVGVSAHADIAVCDTSRGEKTLCAIRFGGYPEQTEAIAHAICAGGTVEIDVGGKLITFTTLEKKYRRKISFDGIYAEAALVAENGIAASKAADGAKKEAGKNTFAGDGVPDPARHENDPPSGSAYLYVPPGDAAALFNAVDRQTAVPLIPRFAEYLLPELKRAGILAPLTILSTVPAPFEVWALRRDANDANIARIVEDGLRTGKITIPGAVGRNAPDASGISGVTDYLVKYGRAVAEHIKSRFVPLFEPGKEDISPEVAAVGESILKRAGYPLYGAQLAAAEAMKRRLMHGKDALTVAECGSGKTKIGITAVTALQAAQGKKKTFNIVLCPSHITKKWVREVEESLEDAFASVVSTPAQFDRLRGIYEKGGKSCFAIMSKESARDGYMRAPAIPRSKSRRAFVCPDCGKALEMPVACDGSAYTVSADQFFFKSETRANHKCAHCGSQLWTALNPRAKSGQWVKIGHYGFVFAPEAREHLFKTVNPEITEKIQEIMDGRAVAAAGAHRKYPLSSYVKKKYKGRIDALLVDELHQYNNTSGQGDAMGELFGAAKKVVGMTATLINGYSSGLFHLLYRFVPGLMEEDGQSHGAPSSFDAEYGVTETTYEISEGGYNANRRTLKRKKRSRPLPGVSPLVYSRFLLEHAVFLSLSDMGKDLPEYEEIPVAIRMPKDVADAYYSMQGTLRNFMKKDKKAAQKILSAYLNLLIAYPDQPYGHRPIGHPFGGPPVVVPPDIADIERLMPKEEAALEIAARKTAAGENVLIYTNWTRLDVKDRLLRRLTEAGIRAAVLPATVKPASREEWIAKRLEDGLRVLITNPAIVETGLDLNAFTTLIFYDTGTKLFTMRQASRRSWRINQTAPRVEVHMLYYADTMQHKLMRLMGTKLAVAAIIEGGFSEEGLASMSRCEDLTTLMAKELMLGIKDSVDDVSDAFKRMAIKKPEGFGIFTDAPFARDGIAEDAEPVEFTFGGRTEPKTLLGSLRDSRPKAVKRPSADENQITFFEKLESIA
jgi:superfamily II DNA or RNA helicase